MYQRISIIIFTFWNGTIHPYYLKQGWDLPEDHIFVTTNIDISYQVNVDGTKYLLDDADRVKTKRFIYISSMSATLENTL